MVLDVEIAVTQRKPYMLLQLRLDQESFDELKALLRETFVFQGTMYKGASEEAPSQRRRREALERVFHQIRYVEYRGA